MPSTIKLKKFNDYIYSLLPHEVDYLQSVASFQDKENKYILESVSEMLLNRQKLLVLDERIDKRKYSRVMHWMQEQLNRIDVDLELAKLQHLEQQIMTDRITPIQEKELIKKLKSQDSNSYNFMRLYEIAQQFGAFLLIRLRSEYQDIVQEYLEKHRFYYLKSREVHQSLNEATFSIVGQYEGRESNTREWESFLTGVFKDEHLDGLNRYFAIVRLTFLHHNYRDYSSLIDLYKELDSCFTQGLFYSRRILANYYSNKVLIHAHFNEWDQAAYFGFLSIKHRGADFIYYVNNLCAILLRSGKHKEALDLMKKSFVELKNTTSAHSRVGFAAFYIQTLVNNHLVRDAASYANTFLEAEQKEVLKYRWHLYFASMLKALVFGGKWLQLIRIYNKYALAEKEKSYQKSPAYLPTINWYYHIARFKLNQMNLYDLVEILLQDIDVYMADAHRGPLVRELYMELKRIVPELPLSPESACAFIKSR